jgi:hypothetical protein
MGRQPYWGTGWAAHGPGGPYHNQQPMPQNTYAYDNPAPPYYRGNEQQTGIEMPARPEHAYGGYAPPPPGKA